MKLTERRRLVLGDVHISLETRGELLRRIDKIYAQLLALTNGDGDRAKLNGAVAPSAASLSPSPTEDSDASFDGDATLVPSPPPLEPEGPSPVPGTPTGHPDVLEMSRRPCVPFGPVPRTRSVGRRCESKPETDGAPPVAAGGAAPKEGGVRRKEARQQPQRAPPLAAKKVDAARGTSLPFRAKPLPVRIFADAYKQQKKAEEEVRQLRSKARAEEMLRCAAVPFTTRRPMFQRQCSDPVPNVPVRETLSRASRRAPPATDILQGDCRKARRSRSCPKLDRRTLPERPALGMFRLNDASPIFQVPAMHFSLVVRSPTPPGTPVRAKAARAGPRQRLPRVQGSAARPETQVGVAGLSLCGVWLIRRVTTSF
ncbi:unnamed protein product [Ixodes persulcatus]